MFKMLPGLFNHADQGVRQCTKGLTVELCRWLGKDTVKRLLFEGLRDATKAELEAEFERVEGRAVPTRRIRSEQMKEIEEPEVLDAPADDSKAAEPEAPPVIDDYDLADPVDILTPLSKTTFYDGIKATKWSERRDAIAELTKLASTIRIAPGDFLDIQRSLKKLTTDVNIAVATEAIQAAGNLAKGLRKDFSSGARLMLPALLERYKEKKPTVVQAIRDTLKAFYVSGCLALTDALEDITTAAKHKVPQVRSEVLGWVAVCIEASKRPQVMAVHKELIPMLVESLQDGTVDVREAGFNALANVAKCVGMKPLERHLESVDEVRKKKLIDVIASAGVTLDAPPQATASRTSGGSQAASRAPPPAKASAASLLSGKAGARPSATGAKVETGSSAAGGKKAGNDAKKPAQAAAPPEEIEPEPWSPETVEERAKAVLPPEMVDNLKSSAWKERLEAMTSIKEMVPSMADAQANVETIVRLISTTPGWSDKNVQVLQKMLECVSALADKVDRFPKKCVVLCIEGLIERVGDIKTRIQATACLTTLAECVGPQFIFTRSIPIVSAHKNPKVLAESITWMVTAVDDFGTAQLNLKELLEFVKNVGLGSSNAPCRSAATKLLGAMHKYVGPDLKGFLSDLKPALMISVETEFEKNPHEPSAAPTRTVKRPSSGAVGEAAAAEGEVVGGGGGGAGLPREDISAKLTATLIANLGNSNWKVRQESMDAVNGIVEEANRRILPEGTFEVFGALKARLSDSNKNLIILAMNTIANLADAMGAPVDKQSRGIISDVLKCLSDPKRQTREAVVKTLDSWLGAMGPDKMIPVVAPAMVDVKIAADGRKELYEWMLRQQVLSKSEPGSAITLLRACAAGLQDKSQEIRKAAEALTTELVKACGCDAVSKAAKHDLPAAAQPPVLLISEKHRVSAGSADGMEEDEEEAPTISPALKGTSRGTRPPSPGSGGRTALPAPVGRSPASASKLGARQMQAALQEAALQNEPLFNLRESIKEERDRSPRGIKVKYEDPRPEQLQELEADVAKIFREDLVQRMFSKDFKQHVAVIDTFHKARLLPLLLVSDLCHHDAHQSHVLSSSWLYPHCFHTTHSPPLPCTDQAMEQQPHEFIEAMEQQPHEFMEVLDLLLRWFVLRIAEANTTSLLRALDFLTDLVQVLTIEGYILTEYEANILLPCLVEKSGHNIANIREKMRELMRSLPLVFPATRVFQAVVEGLRSKNNRTRIECVEHMEAMLERHGIETMGSSRVPLVTVAALTTERDTELRKAALSMLASVYVVLGDDIWRLLGKLTDAQRGLIEDKLKWKAREMEKRREGTPGQQRGRRMSGGAAAGMEAPVPIGALPLATRMHMAEAAQPLAAAPMHYQQPAYGNGAGMVPGMPPGMPHRATEPMVTPPNHMAAMTRHRATDSQAYAHSSQSAHPGPESFFEAILFIDREAAPERVVEGLKYLFHEMRRGITEEDPRVLAVFREHMPRYIKMLRFQFVQFFVRSVPDAQVKTYKYILNSLLTLFETKSLSMQIPDDDLRLLLEDMTIFMLHERVKQRNPDDSSADLCRAVNILLLKILDTAPSTPLFLSFMTILRPTYTIKGSTAADVKGPDGTPLAALIVKCLLRMCKVYHTECPLESNPARNCRLLPSLPSLFEKHFPVHTGHIARMNHQYLRRFMRTTFAPWVQNFSGYVADMDFDRLLFGIHQYFSDFSHAELRRRCHATLTASLKPPALAAAVMTTDERTLSMFRKILAEAVAAKGPAIKGHLSLIPIDETPQPFILQQVDLVLQQVLERSSAADADAAAVPDDSSLPDQDELQSIVRKIVDRKQGAVSLFELHYYMQSHPGIDVFARMSSISETMREYLQMGILRALPLSCAPPLLRSPSCAPPLMCSPLHPPTSQIDVFARLSSISETMREYLQMGILCVREHVARGGTFATFDASVLEAGAAASVPEAGAAGGMRWPSRAVPAMSVPEQQHLPLSGLQPNVVQRGAGDGGSYGSSAADAAAYEMSKMRLNGQHSGVNLRY
ncbi:unnamed protein product [Closterium sp. NIES-65]|nr:unnamed protein product [Closterium sp. NIES-65]